MKIAILGVGSMGVNIIGHLKECPQVKEIVAYDVCEERRIEIQKRFDVRVTAGLDNILRDSTIPLVFVTTPGNTHKNLTMQSLAAGKAVMCEKPMANSLEDARAMLELAEKRKAFLQIGFELRYSKLYTKVKEWIEAGLLGQVINTHCYYIYSECHLRGSWRNRKSTGGSMFGEKLSHYVDLPRWWIGSEVKDVFSVCAPNVIPYYEVRDNYHTVYRFRNGAVSQLTFMMAVAASNDQRKGDGHALRYLVVGTKGAAETDIINRTLKRWEFGDSPECMTSTWVENFTWDPKEDMCYFHNTCDQAKDIVLRVMENRPPKTTARDAYETMRVCFAAEASADTGQIVEIEKFDGRPMDLK